MKAQHAVTEASWEERDGILWSPLLRSRGVVAGFTTRPLGSMGGRGTPLEKARAARDALAARLGFDAVVRLKQVHGTRVVPAPFQWGPARAGEAGPGRTKDAPLPEADAMWTDRAGVLLGIVAADCVPVLVADDQGRIGAAHAGWDGTSRGVAGELVRSLREAGSDPARMVAALGPAIGPCCYTIGRERAAIIQERMGPAADRALSKRDGEVVFDLTTANADQLVDEGVGTVEVSGTCTLSGGADLWSYRGRATMGLGLGLAFIGRTTGGARPPRSPRSAEDTP